MRLCDEWLARNSISPRHARHVKKGFLYFDGGSKLLAIEWMSPGTHPGFYEVSECVLGKICSVLSSRRVDWEEYEDHLVSWMSRASGPVFDKTAVFDLTWRYFIRRHEDSLMSMLPLSEVYKTVDADNPSRLVDCMALVDGLASSAPRIAEFWNSRAFEVVAQYCHWMCEL